MSSFEAIRCVVTYGGVIGLTATVFILFIIYVSQYFTVVKCKVQNHSSLDLFVVIVFAALATGYAQKRDPLNGNQLSPSFEIVQRAPLLMTTLHAVSNVCFASIIANDVHTGENVGALCYSTNHPAVTDLSFFGISRTPTNIIAGAVWPKGMHFPDNAIDLLGAPVCSQQMMTVIAAIDVSAAQTNVVFQFDWDDIVANFVEEGIWPIELTSSAGFFSLASRIDTDVDGLSDWAELNVYLTNPFQKDSDWDGIDDGDELLSGTNPNLFDSDGDGLSDGSELRFGSDPLLVDSDCDGLSDIQENVLGTNPNIGDTDGDGITDYCEIINGCSPSNPDSDGDGISDGEEISSGLNPSGDNFEIVSVVEDSGSLNYDMVGKFHLDLEYTNDTSDAFSIYGIHPPGGSVLISPSELWSSANGPGWMNGFVAHADGVDFVPKKTGYFTFQVCADDEALVRIGDKITATARWPDEGGAVSNLFVAGRSYPVEVLWGSVGGPASISAGAWGVYTPTERPSVYAGFTKRAIIFEDRCETAPGVTNSLRSTMTTLRVGVKGGALGGRLTFLKNGIDRLVLKNQEILPEIIDVPAGTNLSWNCLYEGKLRSNVSNDTYIVAQFVENETEATLMVTAAVTVVEVGMRCAYSAPLNTCSKRHVYGIGERVFCYSYPSSVNVSIVSDDGCVGVSVPGLAEFTWNVCCGSHSLSFLAMDAEYSPMVDVLCPSGVEARNPVTRINPDMQQGFAGGALLEQTLFVTPFTVSFAGLDVEEVPCYDAIPPEGYFCHLPTNVCYRTHSTDAGAGQWRMVSSGNMIGIDRAGYGGKLQRMKPNFELTDDPAFEWLGGGKLIWITPLGWRRIGARNTPDNPDGRFAEDAYQEFSLSADGTFIVKKLGNYAGRKVDGTSLP